MMPLPPSTLTFSPPVPSANRNAGSLRCGIFDVLMYKCIINRASLHTPSTSLSVSASFPIPFSSVPVSSLMDYLIPSQLTCCWSQALPGWVFFFSLFNPRSSWGTQVGFSEGVIQSLGSGSEPGSGLSDPTPHPAWPGLGLTVDTLKENSGVDEPRVCYSEWSKSEREK